MIVITKKRLQIIAFCLIFTIFTFSFQLATKEKTKNTLAIPTVATPVSGKTIVIDAGHRNS